MVNGITRIHWPLSLGVSTGKLNLCLQAEPGLELTKAFPCWWVGLIIILMASQSDAKSSNGKATVELGEGGEVVVL